MENAGGSRTNAIRARPALDEQMIFVAANRSEEINFYKLTRRLQLQTHEPAPPGTLYTQSGGIKLLIESLEGAEGIVDRLLEGRTIAQETAGTALVVRLAQVLPEQGVVNVT